MQNIPNYALYGEKESELFTDYLHIESIRARSLGHGWKFRPHQHHNLHQFFYIAKGGGKALIEKNEHQITDNMLIGVPPLTIHGFSFLPRTKGWVITIPDIYLQDLLKNDVLLYEHLNKVIIFQDKSHKSQKEFQQIFSSIKRERQSTELAYSLTLRSLASLLLAKIVRLNPITTNHPIMDSSRKQIILRSFQKKLNKKFKKRLLVADYAAELNITPTHLNRICKAILDVSASELIQERSLLEAKRLLIYTTITIAEISAELGFCDPGHFSKFFHNKVLQKPSDFRKIFMKMI